MKYIRFERGLILFSSHMQHHNIAFNLHILGKPLSAGFVKQDGSCVTCLGESTSLGLQAAAEDTEALRKALADL